MSSRLELALQYWRDNPVEAIKDWFKATPTDYQGDVLNDMFAPHAQGEAVRVAFKSSHGVGKTTLDAWAGWFWLITRRPSRVVATAPVQAQLHDVLWPEYTKWWAYMPEQLKSEWRPSGAHIRNVAQPDWFAVARTSNRPENLQGFHHQALLIQADEASGVPANVFEVIEGALSEAELEGSEAVLMMTGNPNFNAGEFHSAFHKNKDLYLRYTVAGDPDTEPRKEDGKFYISPRVTKKYRDTMARKYGKDSAVYDVRVRGQFPRQEDGAVIPLEWAEACTMVPPAPTDKVADGFTIAMDVARMGGDETVIAVRCGNAITKLKAWPKTSTEQCVDILYEEYHSLRRNGFKVDRIIVDEPGVGGGVIDSARRQDIPITPYNGGMTMKPNLDPPEDIRMFANKRTRDYWHLRRLCEDRAISIPDDEILVNQMASVHYDYNERDRILVESKRKMRERLGDDASPDRADTIVMLYSPWYTFADNSGIIIEDHDLIFGDDRPSFDMSLN